MNVNRRPVTQGGGSPLRKAFAAGSRLRRYLSALVLGGAASMALAVACSDNERRLPPVSISGGAGGPTAPERCLTPTEGCDCDVEGDQVDCGRVTEVFDDYVTCQMGRRTCTDGLWGECTGDRVTIKSTEKGAGGIRPQALGSSMVCPKDAGVEFDPCDPYCNVTPDTPVGYDAGTGFTTTDAGISLKTIVSDAGVPCNSLTLTPVPATLNTVTPPTVKVTSFTPTTSPVGPVTFTLTPGPMGCAFTSPFATTWVIDAVERATIAGSNNLNGQLTLNVPLGGPVTVTAYALGLTASTTITYRVNVVEAPITNPAGSLNDAASTVAPYDPINAFTTVANACAPVVLDGCRDNPRTSATASTATWLYPQAATYLPLGLAAPWLQYLYASSSTPGAVKASIRYPAGLTQTDPNTIFNYSIIVREQNNAAENYASIASSTLDPQVIIPQTAWQYFEQTARGSDVDLIVQRRTGGAVLEAENRRTIRLVDGQLKGTVFYTSYNSTLAGGTGAVLRISPGATTPTVAVQPTSTSAAGGTRRCTVCHTVNDDGTRLIANGPRPSGGVTFNNSRRYDVSNPAVAPYSVPVVNNFDTSGGDSNNVQGDRFTFGAPFLDGSLYMTHGGDPANDGDDNWRAPPDFSKFYQITAALNASNTNLLTVSNWSNISGVTPQFSRDGTKLAFGFWGAAASTLPCFPTATAVAPCTGSPRKLGSVASGTRLTVVDFSCTSPPCSTSSTGWTVSNARDVTPGMTERAGWPSFTPSGDGVFFQRQFRTSIYKTSVATVKTGTGPNVTISGTPTALGNGLITITTGGALGTSRFSWSYGANSGTNVATGASITLTGTGLTAAFATGTYVVGNTYTWSGGDIGVIGSGWSPSPINTVTGALAEIWLAKVPADGSVAAPAPTRLNALNGLNAAGTATLLPTASRLASPAQNTFHATNASFGIAVPDNCSNTGTANLVNDYQLNYFPSVAPTQAGGYTWVIFTSRRMFGNVAYDDPWDAAPGQSCNSGVPPTKKLWVAAVDSSWTPGTDPSHPAFYLPGQELAAANADGDWVSSPCLGIGSSCSSDDDCCNATGASAVNECRIVATTPTLSRTCQAKSACSNIGAACTTSAQCCSGSCPAGGGVCFIPPPVVAPSYAGSTTTREYVAVCPTGTRVAWRAFEWQATCPTGTSIDFSVQTKELSTDTYVPTTALALSTANPASGTGPGTWYRGASTVDQILGAATPARPSLNYLLVTMKFNTNMGGTATPTLHQWRQIYDCVPAQ